MFSSSDSTYSRFSSCSSRDSIQHWVDSLDDNDNDVVAVPAGHQQGQTGKASRGPSLDNQGSVNPENIPGYGQPLPKKGKITKLCKRLRGQSALIDSNFQDSFFLMLLRAYP